MKEMNFNFSPEKNEKLIKERHISFEEVISVILEGGILEVVDHPNKQKYPKQKIFVLNINDYVYSVPFVFEEKSTLFLKTIIPMRKLTKKYQLEKTK